MSQVASIQFLKCAAIYNAVWGVVAIVTPKRLGRWLGFPATGDGMGWRAAGVVVLAFSPAYLWASAHLPEARPILATAMFGKTIGAVGWIAGLATGRFPLRTAPLPLLNDLVWLPGLWRLLRTAGSRSIPPSPRRGR